MIRRRSTVAISLSALEATRARRATTAAELRALPDEEAASEATRSPRMVAPSSPPRAPRQPASPCPEIERRLRELASVDAWEVEPESGPVTLRPAHLALAMWGRDGDR